MEISEQDALDLIQKFKDASAKNNEEAIHNFINNIKKQMDYKLTEDDYKKIFDESKKRLKHNGNI